MTCFPAAPLTVRRPNVVRPSLPIRKEGERTRTSDVVDVVVFAFESERAARRAQSSFSGKWVTRFLPHWHASTKERKGLRKCIRKYKGGKRQPHCSLNYKSDFNKDLLVSSNSKSMRSNEEQPRPMNSHTSLPPPRAQCLTGAGARLLAHPPIAIIGLDGQADGRILIMIVGPEPETCAPCAVQNRMPSSTVGQSRSPSV